MIFDFSSMVMEENLQTARAESHGDLFGSSSKLIQGTDSAKSRDLATQCIVATQ